MYYIHLYIMHLNFCIYKTVNKVECCGVNWEIYNLKKKRKEIKYSEQEITYDLQA